MLYTFFGDDFTGSTDVLEQLASAGIPTVLFLSPPTPEHLARFPDVQAIGIASDSRSRSPEWMSVHLPTHFDLLRSFGAPVNHYKVCSTFDSSPTHGSIGRAIELGLRAFDPAIVPILVGAPHLRRFVAFGNLFAAAPDGKVHRIDRHPMSRHPVTPMHEADLRRHLAAQTGLPIGHIALTALASIDLARSALHRELAAGARVILFDGADASTLATAGDLIWQLAQQSPIFSAGSSGLTAALVSAWQRSGVIAPSSPPAPHTIYSAPAAAPLLALSGSCSAATEGQLRWALSHGYVGIPLDPAALLHPSSRVAAITSAVESAHASLAAGQSTILYTTIGTPSASLEGDHLGTVLGTLLRDLLARHPARRVLLCGGDTSSHTVQQLGLIALTWSANLQPGAPLCRAHSDGRHLDGLELVLKGGQVGTEDFFEVVRRAP